MAWVLKDGQEFTRDRWWGMTFQKKEKACAKAWKEENYQTRVKMVCCCLHVNKMVGTVSR